MRNAQQRGALCAHGELRNCLSQRQFRVRRRHTTLVPPRGWRGKAATVGVLASLFEGEPCVMRSSAVRCARMAN